MPGTDTRPRQRRARVRTVDGLLGRQQIAQALSMSPKTVDRMLREGALSRSGLWPQYVLTGRRVVRASTLQDYINNLPTVED